MGFYNTRARSANAIRWAREQGRPPDETLLAQLRQQMLAERLEAYLGKALASGPELTNAQRARLANLVLTGGGGDGATS